VKVLNWKSRFAWSFLTVRFAFRAQWLTCVPSDLALKALHLLHKIYSVVRLVRFSQYRAIFPLHSVHRSLLLMEEHCILCEVRTESSYIIRANFSCVRSHARLCEICGGQNGPKVEEWQNVGEHCMFCTSCERKAY
jgi:hypothetical protein